MIGKTLRRFNTQHRQQADILIVRFIQLAKQQGNHLLQFTAGDNVEHDTGSKQQPINQRHIARYENFPGTPMPCSTMLRFARALVL